MTPAEFEWAQEQIEMAYRRGEIGKITFHRRMSALGFTTEGIRQHLKELDEKEPSAHDARAKHMIISIKLHDTECTCVRSKVQQLSDGTQYCEGCLSTRDLHPVVREMNCTCTRFCERQISGCR